MDCCVFVDELPVNTLSHTHNTHTHTHTHTCAHDTLISIKAIKQKAAAPLPGNNPSLCWTLICLPKCFIYTFPCDCYTCIHNHMQCMSTGTDVFPMHTQKVLKPPNTAVTGKSTYMFLKILATRIHIISEKKKLIKVKTTGTFTHPYKPFHPYHLSNLHVNSSVSIYLY